MNAKTYFSYVLAGVAGATALHILVQTVFWVLSLGFTFADYFLIWLTLLPIPVALGIFAGVIVSIVCRSQCQMWAFVLAAIGMIGAMVSIAFGAGGPADNGTMSSIWRPVLSGATVELAVTALAKLGVYLLRRIRS